MKKHLLISLRLTIVMIVLCAGIYPLFIALISKAAPGGGNGETISVNGKVVGYANVGQQFTQEKYFWGRPSAVNYNAAGSGGSNKGPSSPDYLQTVQARIDSFLAHHPGVRKADIPADLVTASGSGLDPHISPQAAYVQVERVAKARGLTAAQVKTLVAQHIEKPFAGMGPSRVNVLRLNVSLDEVRGQ